MATQYRALVWSDFKELWNNSKSIDEVIKKTKQTRSAASSLASRMRKQGWGMKYFNQGRKTSG